MTIKIASYCSEERDLVVLINQVFHDSVVRVF
jgi:hypothetical protein